jgi:hypothetical protein
VKKAVDLGFTSAARARAVGAATEALGRALSGVADRVPCLVGGGGWLSEDSVERVRAAALCGECPVRDECRDLGRATRARFGVWGGRDFTKASGGAPRVCVVHGCESLGSNRGGRCWRHRLREPGAA